MSFSIVDSVLHAQGLEKYETAFREQNVTDDVVQMIIANPDLQTTFNTVINSFGDRVLFLSNFKTTQNSQNKGVENVTNDNGIEVVFIPPSVSSEFQNQHQANAEFNITGPQTMRTTRSRSQDNLDDFYVNVKQVLIDMDNEQNLTKGSQIINNCANNQYLSNSLRYTLVHQMVLYLIKSTHSTRPNTSLRRKLAENIVEQLWLNMANNNKAALTNAFYTPSFMSTYVKDGKIFKRSHEPCGYIQAKLKNMWAAEKRPRLSAHVALEEPTQQTQISELSDSKYLTVKIWLQNNTAPISIVLQKLTVSFTKRRKEMEKMEFGVVVQEWPILVELAEAVIHEFSLLYIDKSDLFYQKWPTVSTSILSYLHKTKITILSCGITVNELNNDQKMGAALYVLPFVLKNKTNRGNLTAKPEDYFIQFIKPQTNMEEFSKAETIRSQPFVTLKGYKSSFEIQESFVMIERRLIKCQSLMQAIDVCLKTYYIFSLKFPKECQWTWSFISEAIYGLKHEKRMIPTVSQFTAEVIVGDVS